MTGVPWKHWSRKASAVAWWFAGQLALLRLRIAASPRTTSIRSICLFGAITDPDNPHVPGLGDLISRNAFLKVLCESHGSARICFVAGPGLIRRFRDFLLNHAYIDEVIECPELGTATLWQWLSFFKRMRKYRFDLCVIDPSSSAVRALHACLCGIPERIGVPLHPAESRFLTTSMQPQASQPGKYPDLLDVTTGFARALNVSRELTVRDITPRFPYARPNSSRSPEAIVAVHVGGDRGWNRRWPLKRYQLLCERLCRDAGVTVYLTGGADDAGESERLLVGVSAAYPPARIFNVSGGTLHEMAHWLDQADVFVGNDSAPMHIAAALGKPVIVLCGPVGAELWQRMNAATVIALETACKKPTEFSARRHRERQRSCVEFNCPYAFDPQRPAYPKCLADIEVDQVWPVVMQHLPMRPQVARQ